jgi:hypothetical protein
MVKSLEHDKIKAKVNKIKNVNHFFGFMSVAQQPANRHASLRFCPSKQSLPEPGLRHLLLQPCIVHTHFQILPPAFIFIYFCAFWDGCPARLRRSSTSCMHLTRAISTVQTGRPQSSLASSFYPPLPFAFLLVLRAAIHIMGICAMLSDLRTVLALACH